MVQDKLFRLPNHCNESTLSFFSICYSQASSPEQDNVVISVVILYQTTDRLTGQVQVGVKRLLLHLVLARVKVTSTTQKSFSSIVYVCLFCTP